MEKTLTIGLENLFRQPDQLRQDALRGRFLSDLFHEQPLLSNATEALQRPSSKASCFFDRRQNTNVKRLRLPLFGLSSNRCNVRLPGTAPNRSEKHSYEAVE